ncbi:MAG: type II toxin-antitoxin system VapC family toxin [Pseudomonadota bacterium]
MQRLLHEQVYLDTNIFIAAVEAFNTVALELFRMAERGLVFLVTSEVTRGELLVKPLMNGDDALARKYETMFDDPNRLTTIPVDKPVIEAAARLSATAGLELLDAVHCATADVAACAYILSEDRDMRTYAEIDVLSLSDLEVAA